MSEIQEVAHSIYNDVIKGRAVSSVEGLREAVRINYADGEVRELPVFGPTDQIAEELAELC